MSTIQFENGTRVQFDGIPTQQDVEEVANKLGLKSPTAQTQDTGPGAFSSAPGTFLDKLAGGLDVAFGGGKVGEEIGTLAAKSGLTGLTPEQRQNVSPGPNIGQLAGDVGQIGLTLGTLGGAGTAGGLTARIGKSALLGGGFGLANALKQKQDIRGTAENVALGGAVGAAVPLAGAGLQKAGEWITDNLPIRFAKFAFPGANTETAQYAIENKPIGTIEGMLNDSRGAVKSIGGQIDSILDHPQYADVKINGKDIIDQVLQQFPQSNYTPEQIINKANDLAPKVGKLVDKLEQGNITLKEANVIRKELDQATKSVYTSLARPPETKQIGAALAGQLRDLVKTSAPETEPVFNNLQKEINLRGILMKISKSADRASAIGIRDIVIGGGLGELAGGPVGAVAGTAIKRVTGMPAVDLGAAKFLNLLGKTAPAFTNPVTTNVSRAGLLKLFTSNSNR